MPNTRPDVSKQQDPQAKEVGVGEQADFSGIEHSIGQITIVGSNLRACRAGLLAMY